LRLRPLVVAPMAAVSLAALVWGRAPAGQLTAVVAGFVAFLSFFAYESWRGRRRLVTAGQLLASLAVTALGIGLQCRLTGGIGSPFLPMLFAPTVVAFAAFGRAPGRLALAWLVLIALGLVLAPASSTLFPPLPPPAFRLVAFASAACAGALLWIGVTGLSDAYATAREALGQVGEQVAGAAAARAQALEALGATVAHEIRNPLAAIKGLVELLIENADPSRARKRLDVINGEVGRMETILNDYLTFAKPWGELARASIDVREVATSVAGLLEARAERDGVELSVTPGAGLRVAADPLRLKEALLNLILNALHATPSGGSVRIGCDAGDGAVAITVADTGPGLDSGALARLGERFYSTREGGAGLGVLLARRVAEQHGGTLTFTSAPGQGTTALFTLPLPTPLPTPLEPRADRPAV
jgi:signal transduction histidine kinase